MRRQQTMLHLLYTYRISPGVSEGRRTSEGENRLKYIGRFSKCERGRHDVTLNESGGGRIHMGYTC